MQVINTFFGGTLYQDLPTQCSSGVCRRSTGSATYSQHSIQCLRDGRLYSILGKERLTVSSIHHQAVKKVIAFADDGVIEAMESVSRRNIWGVQFHPELQLMENNEDMKNTSRFCLSGKEQSLNNVAFLLYLFCIYSISLRYYRFFVWDSSL